MDQEDATGPLRGSSAQVPDTDGVGVQDSLSSDSDYPMQPIVTVNIAESDID